MSDERVVAAVRERFVPLKQRLGVHREASRRYRPFWTPTLLWLDPDGRVLLRWPGLIPADELLAQLDLGEALVGLRRGRFAEALDRLEACVDAWPESAAAPEALYWAGNVRYVMDGDRQSLDTARKTLTERYPESPAALRV
jgi:hypothetical protein